MFGNEFLAPSRRSEFSRLQRGTVGNRLSIVQIYRCALPTVPTTIPWCALACDFCADNVLQGIKVQGKTSCDACSISLPRSLAQRQEALNAVQIFSFSTPFNQALMSIGAINIFFVYSNGLSHDTISLLTRR